MGEKVPRASGRFPWRPQQQFTRRRGERRERGERQLQQQKALVHRGIPGTGHEMPNRAECQRAQNAERELPESANSQTARNPRRRKLPGGAQECSPAPARAARQFSLFGSWRRSGVRALRELAPFGSWRRSGVRPRFPEIPDEPKPLASWMERSARCEYAARHGEECLRGLRYSATPREPQAWNLYISIR